MSLAVRDLQLLDALATEGTLIAAAERLYVSQPALSLRLSKLEEHLGTELFERRGRRLVPNPAGQHLITAASRILRDLAAVENDVREIGRTGDQRVRLATHCATTYSWLTPVLRDFRGRHPAAQIGVETVPGDDALAALLQHTVDVAIVTKLDRRADDLELTHLFDDELVVVVAPDHPWAGRRRIVGRDFDAEHVVLYDTYDQSRIPAPPLPLPPGARPRRVSTVPLVTDLVIELVAAGEGVSVLPAWMAQPHADRGEVCLVPMSPTSIRRWYAAVRRDERRTLPRALAELLVEHLGAPRLREVGRPEPAALARSLVPRSPARPGATGGVARRVER